MDQSDSQQHAKRHTRVPRWGRSEGAALAAKVRAEAIGHVGTVESVVTL